MKIIVSLFVVCLTLLGSVNVFAQTKPTKFVKYTPPKLFTTIGVLKDSAKAPMAQAKAILGQKLIIKDAKGSTNYTIQSYQFIYTKRTVSEDENGNAIASKSIVAKQFYNGDPLPVSLVTTMREQMLEGEELYFFDIIVKDDKGRIMFAPTLKIFIGK